MWLQQGLISETAYNRQCVFIHKTIKQTINTQFYTPVFCCLANPLFPFDVIHNKVVKYTIANDFVFSRHEIGCM